MGEIEKIDKIDSFAFIFVPLSQHLGQEQVNNVRKDDMLVAIKIFNTLLKGL